MLARSNVLRLSKRTFSSVVAEGPRMTIAKNIIAFNKIASAKDDAALSAASTTAVSINVAEQQPELKGLEGYLSSGPAAGAAFVKDPTAWQNMELSAFVSTESARADTWPFLVGGL